MEKLEISVLGPPQIMLNGHPVEVGHTKGVALLIYLAVTEQVHSRESLTTLLWPDYDSKRGRAELRRMLWAINNTLGKGWLVADRQNVKVSAERAIDVDLHKLRHLSQTHRLSSALEADELERTLALYSGRFLSGFTLPDSDPFESWRDEEAFRLEQEVGQGYDRLSAWLLVQHPHSNSPLKQHLQNRLALEPAHEPSHRLLIAILAKAGESERALAQAGRCRDVLLENLAAEPSELTETLVSQVRRGEIDFSIDDLAQLAGLHALLDRTVAGRQLPQTETAVRHNLPNFSTVFIGRKHEIGRISRVLQNNTNRLLTILGPGGIGKTRLALEVGATRITDGSFPDGVYFVPLAPLSDDEGIGPAIAEAVELKLQEGRKPTEELLIEFLRKKSVLLILDNFEHLLEGASLVDSLLQNCPSLHILVTSRERLNLYEEQRYPLGGLSYPDELDTDSLDSYDAIDLFLNRVRQNHPEFNPNNDELNLLAQICRLVEGMPLGLELAAAWSDILSLSEIQAEIEASLDFLESDARNIPSRHRSIRAVINSSWERLNKVEQEIFAQLSIFRGGFTREAVAAVTNASPRQLASLVRQSLIRFNQAENRYDIHELIRQFATEKLAKFHHTTLMLHANYYCGFLAARESTMRGKGQALVLAEIEQELENCTTAFQTAIVEKRIDWLRQALICLGGVLVYHGRFSEGESLIQAALDASSGFPQYAQTDTLDQVDRDSLIIRLWVWHGRFLRHLNRYEEAKASVEHAAALIEQSELDGNHRDLIQANLLMERARINFSQEFGGATVTWANQSLALFRSLNDLWGVGLVLELLSMSYVNIGKLSEAETHAQERLKIQQHFQNRRGIGRAYSLLGLIALHMNRLEDSEAYLQNSLTLMREGNNRVDLTLPMMWLGVVYLFSGKFAETVDAAKEYLSLCDELGILPNETMSVSLSRALLNLGRYKEAKQHAERNYETYTQTKSLWALAFAQFNLGRIAIVEDTLDEASAWLDRSCDIMRQMDNRNLFPEVLFVSACCHILNGNRDGAIVNLVEGLNVAVAAGELNSMRLEFPTMALLQLLVGRTLRAIEFYEAGRQISYISNSAWFDDVIGRKLSKAASAFPPEQLAAAKTRGRERNLWDSANEILQELKPQ